MLPKKINLDEARKDDKLDQFCKEHPTEGDEPTLDGMLDRIAKKPSKDDQTSAKADDAC